MNDAARKTRILRVDPEHPDAAIIDEAGEVIRRGGLVAFPTETVYGLGANALDSEAVARIFRAKARPAHDPIIVHLLNAVDMQTVAHDIPPIAWHLADVFMPGALTFILHRGETVPYNVTAGTETVAVRVPSHAVARALIAAAGVPIAAPSANTFSRPSATTAAHVLEDLDGRIDLILDGGSTPIGVESTVLDLTDEPTILRPGGVSWEALLAYLPDLRIRSRALSMDSIQPGASSPGQSIKHYSPRARLLLYDGERLFTLQKMRSAVQSETEKGKRVAILATDEDISLLGEMSDVYRLGSDANLEGVAASLFAGLRALDANGVDVIFARGYGREGIGAAIWDRLLRAAEGKIIK